MTDALYIYLKGEHALSQLPPHLAERATRQWETLKGQTALMDKELNFCKSHQIQVICYDDEAYPHRLREREDAPLILFYLGNTPLNGRPIISIIGTRKITPYGKDLCRQITDEIGQILPDALIVSGLAYGVDVHAHRGALAKNLSTAGVLAHGLDRIYPYVHRDIAAQMTRQGGLLTEYPMGTEPERYNFVHRNRIVAAMADCVIVVESALKGGSMITVDRAHEMGRQVYACPGRLTDIASGGCNRIIAEGVARPYVNAADLIQRMGWHKAEATPAQPSLFDQTDANVLSLSPEGSCVVEALRSADSLSSDKLSTLTGLPAQQLTAILMDLDMEGIIDASAPGAIRLLK